MSCWSTARSAPAASSIHRRLRTRVFLGALVAALAAGGVAATFAISFATDTGRRADAKVYDRVGERDAPQLRRLGRRIGGKTLDIAAAAAVAATGIVLAALSRLRRARFSGWAVALLLIGAFATTELLKDRLGERGRELAPRRVPDTFPSGHATLAMGIVLACVLSMPRHRRTAATLVGSVVATLLGLLIVVGNLHPPSDVVGGWLVAAAWAALLASAVRSTERPATRDAGRFTGVFAAIALLSLVFVILVGAYVEDALGADWLLLALTVAIGLVSTAVVAVVGALADLAP